MGAIMSSDFQPFMIAACVMGGLVLIEVLSLLFGASISGIMEGLTGTKALDDVGIFSICLGWLNVGKVPLLALLIMILALFSAFGFAIQSIAFTVLSPLPGWTASLVSLALALPATRWLSLAIAKIIPRDETYAMQKGDLIGRTGIISLGPVQKGSVARLKIQDQWGNWHFPRVAPAKAGDVIPQGIAVLVVDRSKNELLVIRAEEGLLPE